MKRTKEPNRTARAAAVTAIASVLCLSGCGGNGGGSSVPVEPYVPAVPLPTVRWPVDVPGGVTGKPVVESQGQIFFGSPEGTLYALYPGKAEPASRRMTHGAGLYVALGTSGLFYVLSEDGFLFALRPNLTLAWSCFLQEKVSKAPAVDEDGTVYVATNEGNVHAVAHGGARLWTYSRPQNKFFTPTVLPHGTILLCTRGGYLEALNAREGATVWRQSTPAPVACKPLTERGDRIYVAGDHFLTCFSGQGEILWRTELSGAVRAPIALGPRGGIYVATDEPALYRISPQDGTRITVRDLNKPLIDLSVGSKGDVFACSEDGFLIAFDVGLNEKWRFIPCVGFCKPAALSADSSFLVVPLSNETVVGLRADSGSPLNNLPPHAQPDTYRVRSLDSLQVAPEEGVLANDCDPDGDALTVVLVEEPHAGEVELFPDGSFRYTPNEDFSGVDSFTYSAVDGATASDPVTVVISCLHGLWRGRTSQGYPIQFAVQNGRIIALAYKIKLWGWPCTVTHESHVEFLTPVEIEGHRFAESDPGFRFSGSFSEDFEQAEGELFDSYVGDTPYGTCIARATVTWSCKRVQEE